jgi:putative tryptophan/tyrosine transport system substrate-binding protein
VVEDGLAESLARRGKNVTGISGYASTELWSKLLQLLKEAKPDIKRIGILWTYVPTEGIVSRCGPSSLALFSW